MYHTGMLSVVLSDIAETSMKSNPNIKTTVSIGGKKFRYYTGATAEGLTFYFFDIPNKGTSTTKPTLTKMQIRVNFSKLLRAGEHVVLPTAADDLYKILRKKYFEVIPDVLPCKALYRPDFDCISVSRLDYCYNITGLSQELIDSYIRILSKGNLEKFPAVRRALSPSGKVKQYTVDENNNEVKMRDGSLYCGNQSITINIYDKRKMMLKFNEDHKKEYPNGYYSSAAIDAATGVLRCEIQCNGKKLYNLCKSNGLQKSIKECLDPHLSKSVLLDYVSRISYKETHYNSRKWESLIAKANHTQIVKEQLLEILELVSIKGMKIFKVREKTKTAALQKRATFNSRIRTLRKDGINPIPIPINKGSELESLYSRLQREYDAGLLRLVPDVSTPEPTEPDYTQFMDMWDDVPISTMLDELL